MVLTRNKKKYHQILPLIYSSVIILLITQTFLNLAIANFVNCTFGSLMVKQTGRTCIKTGIDYISLYSNV